MQIIPVSFFEESNIKELNMQFESASPYKHIKIDNFLSPEFAETIEGNFPGLDKMSRNYQGLNEHKFSQWNKWWLSAYKF